MSDPNTQHRVTSRVTTDAAATGCNSPEGAGPRPVWLVALELLLNHPAARKIAVATIATFVLLVAFIVQYAPRWLVNAKTGKATPILDVYPADDQDDDGTDFPPAIGMPHDLAGAIDVPADFIVADKKQPAAPPPPPPSE